MAENVNLGTLSVSISANLSKFTSGINQAIKSMTKFQQVASQVGKNVASASLFDPKSMLQNLSQMQGVAKKAISKMSKNIQGNVPNFQLMTGDTGQFVEEVDKYKSSLQTMVGSGKKVTSTISAVSSGALKARYSIKDLDKSFSGLGKRAGGLSKFLGGIAHYISFSIGVQLVMAIRQGFSVAISSFLQFEKTAANVAAISGKLGDSFDDVKDSVMSLSKVMATKVLFSAQEIATTMYTLASAGYDVTRMTEQDLIPIFQYAQATQSDLASSTESLINVMKSFKLEIEDLTYITDIFTSATAYTLETMERLKEGMKYVGPIAGELGLGLADTTAALSQLVDRGAEGGQAGQRLTMILTKLLKPTDEAKDDLERLGLSMEELDPTTNSLVDIFLNLRAAGFGVAEATHMFRSRTAGAAATLVGEAESINYLSQRLEMATGFTSAMAEAQKTTLAGSVQLAQQSIQNLSLELGQNLAPLVVEVSKGLKDTLVPIIQGLGVVFTTISKNINLFKGALSALVTIFSIWIVKTKVLPLLLNLVGTATKMLSGVMMALSGAYVTNTGTVVVNTAAMGAQTGIVTTLTAAFDSLTFAISMVPGLGWALASIGIAAGVLAAFALSTDRAGDSTAKYTAVLTDNQNKIASYVSRLQEEDKTIKEISEDILKGSELKIAAPWELPSEIGNKEIFNQVFSEIQSNLGITKEEFQKLDKEVRLDMIIESISNLQTKADAFKQVTPYFSDITLPDLRSFNDFISTSQNLTDSQRDLLNAFLNTEVGSEESTIALQALKDAGVENIDVISQMHDVSLSYVDAEKQLVFATDELRNAQEEFNNGGQTNIKTQERLIKANRNYEKANQGLITVIGSIIQSIRQIPGSMDYYISKMEEVSNSKARMEALSKDLVNVERNENNALKELTESLLTYGAGSEEAINSQQKLNAVIKEKIDIDAQIAALNTDIASSSLIVTKALDAQVPTFAEINDELKELNTQEQEILTYVQKVISARDAMIKALSDEEIAEANLRTIEKVRAEGTKYLQDKLLKLYEAEDKIFDIESNIYKLRKDESKQVDDLFESLASQGLISEDMIDTYRDMKKSEGEVVKLNKGFAEVISSLTPEQQKWATQLLNSQKGTEDYNEALQGLEGSGVTDLDVILAMKEAQDNLTSSLSTVEGAMNPVIQQLVDMGVISADAADKYYDLIDNTAELAKENADLEKTQSGLGDNFNTLVNIIGQMGKSMITGEEGASSFSDIMELLASQLGISAITTEELANLVGVGAGENGEYTDAQYALAAALKLTGTNLGQYQTGMTGVDLATKLGIVSSDNAVTSFNNLLTVATDSISPLTTYKDALTNVGTQSDITKTAVGNLETAVSDLRLEIEGKAAPVIDVDVDTGKTKLKEFEDEYNITINNITNASDTCGTDAATAFFKAFTGSILPLVSWFTTNIYTPISNAIGGLLDWGRSGLASLGIHLAKGGIITAQAGGMMRNAKWNGGRPGGAGILRGPKMVLAGEAGDEAFIPLQGINKKYGSDLLKYIIPRYFPELQQGGVFRSGRYIPPQSQSPSVIEYNIYGPINVNGVTNVDDFLNQLKYKARASKR